MCMQHVDEQLKTVRKLGVSGVPFFVFKSGGISGAQVRALAADICNFAMLTRAPSAGICAAAVHHRGRWDRSNAVESM